MIKAQLWASLADAAVEYPSLLNELTEDNFWRPCYTEESEERVEVVLYDRHPTFH